MAKMKEGLLSNFVSIGRAKANKDLSKGLGTVSRMLACSYDQRPGSGCDLQNAPAFLQKAVGALMPHLSNWEGM